MHKHLLVAALMAAAKAAEKQKCAEVVIRARPEALEVTYAEPMKLNHGDTWRRNGKRKGRRAS